MMRLINKINSVKRTKTKKVIDARMKEFVFLGKKSDKEIFKELCFCVLTANFNAERGIMIQKEIGNGFLTLKEKQLAKKLKQLGYRYPNLRANFIVENQNYKNNIKKKIAGLDHEERRNWIVKNVKGLGMKEASHFLRNIGFSDYAIIDFHIVDLLVAEKVIKRPKTIGRGSYLEIEKKLRKISEKSSLSLAELDLYLWYLETGKVLK